MDIYIYLKHLLDNVRMISDNIYIFELKSLAM